jgi:hypothetical protein
LFKCVYSISRHTMICDSDNYSSPNASYASNTWLSGNNTDPNCTDCQNNPDRTGKKYENHGPIPPRTNNGYGVYNIGPLLNGKRALTPNPDNGRSGFQIHYCGQSSSSKETCSNGCISSTDPADLKKFNDTLSSEEGHNTLFIVF